MGPGPRPVVAHDVVVAELRSLGVEAGDIVMVHTSMRKVGPVAGGCGGLLAALQTAVSPQGTLLMVLGADESDESEPFDALTSPVDTDDMGVFAEFLRTFPGVQVNDHAADRFAALGPDARFLLEPVPLHHYHGPGSVLERFTERNGRVLRLGANVDTVTLTHYAEYLCAVPEKVCLSRRCERADTGVQWIESLDDTDFALQAAVVRSASLATRHSKGSSPQSLRVTLGASSRTASPTGKAATTSRRFSSTTEPREPCESDRWATAKPNSSTPRLLSHSQSNG